MSSLRDKAPVADAIGAFLLYASDAAARGIEPLAAAGWTLRRSNPLQRFLDPEGHRCANDLAQLRWFDRLRAALDQQLSEFGRCLFAETSLLVLELGTLFTQLLQRISCSRFGPGHSASFLLAVGPLRSRSWHCEVM